MQQIEFRTGVIRPLECFREGFDIIKPDFWLFFAITLVGMLIAGAVPFAILLGAMNCGIYFCILKQMRGEPVQFGDLFKGFQFFVPALVATLVLIVPMIIFMVINWISIFGFLMVLGPDLDQGSGTALFGLYAVIFGEAFIFALVSACIHTFLIFAYPLIVEYSLSGLDAFKLSARAAWANLSGVVGIILWEFILGFAGFLVCGIGFYFVLPVMFAAVAVAYRRVFPEMQNTDFGPPPPESYNFNG